MNKETLRMQMLAGIITEGQYKKKLKEVYSKLKFNQVERDRKYFATTNFGIFKKGDEVFVDTVRNLGTEVVLELSNSKGKHDSIKGDLEDEVGVFDNSYPFTESQYKARLNENEENIVDFLNQNMGEITSKLGDVFSNFEGMGDPKVATAGEGEKGIDISFDKEHMLELFPEGDPYNKVKSIDIAGKIVYYNDYRY